MCICVVVVLCSVCGLLCFFLRIRRPPRSTRTDTLFPYTTLFRSSADQPADHLGGVVDHGNDARIVDAGRADHADGADHLLLGIAVGRDDHRAAGKAEQPVLRARSEERRVGKERDSTCSSRWSPYHYKKKTITKTKHRTRPTCT